MKRLNEGCNGEEGIETPLEQEVLDENDLRTDNKFFLKAICRYINVIVLM